MARPGHLGSRVADAFGHRLARGRSSSAAYVDVAVVALPGRVRPWLSNSGIGSGARTAPTDHASEPRGTLPTAGPPARPLPEARQAELRDRYICDAALELHFDVELLFRRVSLANDARTETSVDNVVTTV